MKTKTISVDYLARVEGEGALYVDIEGDQVKRVELKIFEPPRFFEAFLRGRDFREAPDITARICGICPVAYQMSAVHAMESALHIEVPKYISQLRRLLYCGEWIESHGLHLYMLHAPDFLGFQDAVQMAKVHRGVVEKGLKLKKVGNSIVKWLGGREIHPINVRVGGFYKLPSQKDAQQLIEDLKWAKQAAIETVQWVGGFEFPEMQRDYTFVALEGQGEYPFCDAPLVSNRGLRILSSDYEKHFEEIHVERSNALHSQMRGGGAYHVGPMARYALNYERLTPLSQQVARDVGLPPICQNPFQSIVVRAVEILYACEEALRILQEYDERLAPSIVAKPQAGEGFAITEAPRGILYHRYQLREDGIIEDAEIIPPTSQNQMSIEEDLFTFVSQNINMPEEELQWHCEQTVRNYDPCISCATHFLKLHINRNSARGIEGL